jgi:hypothetical protein
MMTDPLSAPRESPAQIPTIPTASFVRRQSNLEIMWVLSSVAALSILTYPMAAFILCTVLLINLPEYAPKAMRRLLAVSVVCSVSFVMSLRPLDTGSNDIDVYYRIYSRLREDSYDALFEFGGGIEVGLPAVMYLLGKGLPYLSPQGLMFCLALISSLIFVSWIESAFYADRIQIGPLLMGCGLLLFNLYYSTQLVRQFFALALLLYSISSTTKRRSWLFLTLACLFHLTALPFYVLYLIGKRGWQGPFALVLISIAFRVFFGQLLAIVDIFPPAIADKLTYYVSNNQEYTDADLGSLKLIALLCMISVVSFVSCSFRLSQRQKRWHIVPWTAALVHVALLSIPLAALRVTMIIHSMATGVIAHEMFGGRRRVVLIAIMNVLLLYKLLGYFSLDGSPASVSTWEALEGMVP